MMIQATTMTTIAKTMKATRPESIGSSLGSWGRLSSLMVAAVAAIATADAAQDAVADTAAALGQRHGLDWRILGFEGGDVLEEGPIDADDSLLDDVVADWGDGAVAEEIRGDADGFAGDGDDFRSHWPVAADLFGLHGGAAVSPASHHCLSSLELRAV